MYANMQYIYFVNEKQKLHNKEEKQIGCLKNIII